MRFLDLFWMLFKLGYYSNFDWPFLGEELDLLGKTFTSLTSSLKRHDCSLEPVLKFDLQLDLPSTEIHLALSPAQIMMFLLQYMLKKFSMTKYKLIQYEF